MSAAALPPELPGFCPDEEHARALDAGDVLGPLRERFHLPCDAAGEPLAYFAGNSLGLQPKTTSRHVQRELEDWARLAVAGHFEARRPWLSYHEAFREPLGRLVGALPHEVVAMNSTTVNLHLMLASFYRPTPERHRVLMEDAAFPSDTYAVRSQLRLHGFDPQEALFVATDPAGSATLSTATLERLLDERGEEIALVLLGGVNYYTGQWFDLERITARARARGCVVGWDLAHAVGNVPLHLHEHGVDFAVWCSYKYLNAGPGAVAGCFVHERHAERPELLRMAGWWGNDPGVRFRMHLEPEFVPARGADGWQVSNPPVLSLAPLGAALELFDEVGLGALRARSLRLTGYLEQWIDAAAAGRVEIVTPRAPGARGCQLSLRVPADARGLAGELGRRGVVVDLREPDVVRAAPAPLYNSFHDVWRLGSGLAAWVACSEPPRPPAR